MSRAKFKRPTIVAAVLLGLFLATSPSQAGEVDVVAAKARLVRSSGAAAAWHFDVTLRHADAGWNHYADNWKILKMDGTLSGPRVLLHPHVGEQPFTRSLVGVKTPAAIKKSAFAVTTCAMDMAARSW